MKFPLRSYATEKTFLDHPCAKWELCTEDDGPLNPRELLRSFRQDMLTDDEASDDSMEQVGPTEESVLNRGLAFTGGTGVNSKTPNKGLVMTPPPALSPYSPASKSQRRDPPTGVPRRALSFDPEEAGPSHAVLPLPNAPQPAVHRDPEPGTSASSATANIGGSDAFSQFMHQMRPLFDTRVIHRSAISASANIRIDDRGDPETIINAVLRARDMLQLRKKNFLKYDIQASLVLRREEEDESISYSPFLASTNTSLFNGRPRVFSSQVNDLREFLESISLHERVVEMAPKESKESLECIPSLVIKFFFLKDG